MSEKYNVNIYKLKNKVTLEHLEKTVTSTLEERADTRIFEKGTKDQKEDKVFYCSYKIIKDKNSDIKWHEKWLSFFDLHKPFRSVSITGHGIISIFNSRNNQKYIIIFGRAFALIKDLIVDDFGISMADKLFDGKSASSISGKFFSMVKNKSISDYYEGSSLYINDGEAIDLLKTRITEDNSRNNNLYIDELKSIISPIITIHFAYINITIAKDSITLEDIIYTVNLLSKIESEYRSRFKLPRMYKVNQSVSKYLDDLLITSIKNQIEDCELQISTPIYFKNKSNHNMFLSDVINMRVYFGHQEIEGARLTQDEIRKFIFDVNTNDIRKINIDIVSNGYTGRDTLMKWLDISIPIEDENGNLNIYVLYDGKWCTYNDAYIERVQSKVIEFEERYTEIIEEYSINKEKLDFYYNSNKLKIDKAFSKNVDPSIYREFKYNHLLSTQRNWSLFDRKLFNNIEICDLQVYKKAHIHVKIGNLGMLETALRQSIRGEQIFSQEKNEVFKRISSYDNKKLVEARKVIVLFLNTYNIRKISDSSSLKLKLTFLDWVEEIKNLKKECKIIFGIYDKNNIKGKNFDVTKIPHI